MSKHSDNIPPKNKRKHRPGMGGPMGAKTEKAKNFKGTVKKLLTYMKPYMKSIIVALVLAIGSAAFSIAGPKILGNATTKIFEGLIGKVSGEGTGIDFGYIENTLLLLVGLYAVSSLFAFITKYIVYVSVFTFIYDFYCTFSCNTFIYFF